MELSIRLDTFVEVDNEEDEEEEEPVVVRWCGLLDDDVNDVDEVDDDDNKDDPSGDSNCRKRTIRSSNKDRKRFV